MKKIITTFLLVFSIVIVTNAQDITATTADGKRVVLKTDGTWQYIKGASSSVAVSDCDYWKDEVDEFTNEVKRYTRSRNMAKSEDDSFFSLGLRKMNTTRLIYSKFEGNLGCMTNESKMLVKLENDVILEFVNFAPEECGENATMAFNLEDEAIKALRETPIKVIRINGSEGYTDLKVIDAEYFIKTLKCVE